MIKHTFAICAYGRSVYLEKCVKSVVNQTVKSKVIICTSTPSKFICSIAEKYNIPLYIRNGTSNIRDDWNFAYNTADTEYVTVAHQDDIYHKEYTGYMIRRLQGCNSENVSIYYTGYRPLKNGEISIDLNCVLRGVLRSPMLLPVLRGRNAAKRVTLAFGNSICCPTVTYNKGRLGSNIFTSDMSFNIDWDTFYKLANTEGEFLYEPKSLVLYRIHDEATSKKFIEDNNRYKEDVRMFNRFWPMWLTKMIMKIYIKAYDTYD